MTKLHRAYPSLGYIRYKKLIRVTEQLQGGVLPKEHRDDVSAPKDQVWIVQRENIVIS
jgi:hypothetical protein